MRRKTMQSMHKKHRWGPDTLLVKPSVGSLASCLWLGGQQEQAKVTEHEKGVHISRAASDSGALDELF